MKDEQLEIEIKELKEQVIALKESERSRKLRIKRGLKYSIIFALCTFSLYGLAVITSLHIFAPGDTISAQKINENFAYLESQITGGGGGSSSVVAKFGLTSFPWSSRVATDGSYDSDQLAYVGEDNLVFDNVETNDGNLYDHTSGFTYYEVPSDVWYQVFMTSPITPTITLTNAQAFYETDPATNSTFLEAMGGVGVEYSFAELDGSNNVINESQWSQGSNWMSASYYDNDSDGIIQSTELYAPEEWPTYQTHFLKAGQIIKFKTRWNLKHDQAGDGISVTINTNGRVIIVRKSI